ncbi:hypothetical protein BV20DRAFT_960160 [Pilatotrama ljubarskyi]|nr:hypothetical protein BV20DRAFT_960160 [Pilatotrama ljubarskyi]
MALSARSSSCLFVLCAFVCTRPLPVHMFFSVPTKSPRSLRSRYRLGDYTPWPSLLRSLPVFPSPTYRTVFSNLVATRTTGYPPVRIPG